MVLAYLIGVFAFSEPMGAIRFQHIVDPFDLSNPIVTAMVQDNAGQIWLGTQFGLNVFDGYSVAYVKPGSWESGVDRSWIRALHIDAKGVLWVALRDRLLRYDASMRDFIEVHLPGQFDDVNIRALNSDLDSIFVSSEAHGTLIGRCNSGVDEFHFEPFQPLGDRMALAFQDDDMGRLWIGHVEGLSVLSPDRKQISEVDGLELCVSLSGDDKRQQTWATDGRQLLNLSWRDLSWQRHAVPFVDGGWINDIYCDVWGDVWCATSSGLLCFNSSTKEWTSHQYNRNQPWSIQSSHCLDLLPDADGNIWVSTYGKGVSLFRPRAALVSWKNFEDDPQKTVRIWRIRAGKESSWWLAAGDAGLIEIDRDNFSVKQRVQVPFSDLCRAITEMVATPDGNTWLLGTCDGIFEWDPARHSHKAFLPSEYEHRSIRSMVFDREGQLWVATDQGIDRIVDGEISHLSTTPTMQLLLDRKGVVWAGSLRDGLFAFDEEQVLKSVSLAENNNHRHSFYVRCITESKDGNLWIGTDRGVYELDNNRKPVRHIGPAEGLVEPLISSVFADELDRVWIATLRGIQSYDLTTERLVTHGLLDGFPAGFMVGSYMQTEAGQITLGGLNGLISFDPKKIKSDEVKTRLSLGQVDIKNVELATQRSLYVDQNGALASFELEAAENWISIELKNIIFPIGGRQGISYRINKGNWVKQPANQRHLVLTGLRSGSYALDFTVDKDNFESTGISVVFRIKPPWYASRWAFIGYGFACICLGLLVFMYLRQRYQRKLAHQTQKMQIQVLEGKLNRSRLALLQSQLQPHFLFNTLNSISSLVRDGELDLADELIAEFADLFRFVLSHKDDHWISVAEELEFVRRYLSIEKTRFGARLNVEVICDDQTAKYQMPALLIQPLVENAIKHGVGYQGTIRVLVGCEEERIHIEVTNSGGNSLGSYELGLGLSSIKDRLAICFGTLASMTLKTVENHTLARLEFPVTLDTDRSATATRTQS